MNRKDKEFVKDMDLSKWNDLREIYWAMVSKIKYYVDKKYENHVQISKLQRRAEMLEYAQVKYAKGYFNEEI
jgi:hypothetical protein